MKKVTDITDLKGTEYWHIADFVDTPLEKLLELPSVDYPEYTAFGKPHHYRRSVSFFSDEVVNHKYSKGIVDSHPLSDYPILVELLEKVCAATGTKFNGILYNKYNSGEDCIGPHSDTEENLDTTGNRLICGLSFGAVRLFRIRDKNTGKRVLDHHLQHGTLIGMQGRFQDMYKHEIPVQKTVKGVRVSLTFRQHKTF